jgi:adenylate cyclase class 2
MSITQEYEIEVKFFLVDPNAFEERLKRAGARILRTRTYEFNLRFDTPSYELRNRHCILRLRRDNESILTYKGSSDLTDGVASRLEIEFKVSDFESARKMLEALGFQVSGIYEKYRTVYGLDGLLITIDDMPFGNFSEIEGEDADSIRMAAMRLGLEWDARILDNYLALFEKVKESMGLSFRDLSFENFESVKIPDEIIFSLFRFR